MRRALTYLAALLVLASSALAITRSGSPLIGSSTPAGIPAGLMTFVVSGTCPATWSEIAELNGTTLVGTLTANGDAGTKGGSDAVTPAGTVSQPTFSGNALAGHAHSTGTFANAATSAGTPAGTTAWPANVPTFSGSALGTHAHAVGTYANTAASGGTPEGTTAWPAGVPTHSGTAATFTGNSSTTVVNHLHALATGTGATGNFSQVIGTVDTSSGGTGGTPTQTALGTLSGNPTVGGAANYTPAGSVNITSQGTIAWPAGVPAFSGSALANHNHTVGGSSEAVTAGTPAGTVAWPANPPTFSGSALGNHTHTFSGSSESVGAGTPSGTVSQSTFTGTQLDNRSAFTKVIFCRKD